MYNKFVFSLVLSCFIVSCSPPSEIQPPAFNPAKFGIAERNVTYCVMDGVPLKMDVYYPLAADGPSPAVVYVHGGGWVEGSRDSIFGAVDVKSMQEAGYLMVSVDYRLAPRYKFPAMIEDVKCAIRYLRAHAVSYNLDPSKIGVIGASAGGHLASLLGLTDDSDFDTGEYRDYSSRAQAVVDLFGPADLAPEYARKLFFDPLEVFGTADGDAAIFFDASPVNYVTPDDPPFLIIHGNLDTTVPPLQSKMLFKALQAAGVSSELIPVKKAGHNLTQEGLEPITPSLEEIEERIMLFWDLHLK